MRRRIILRSRFDWLWNIFPNAGNLSQQTENGCIGRLSIHSVLRIFICLHIQVVALTIHSQLSIFFAIKKDTPVGIQPSAEPYRQFKYRHLPRHLSVSPHYFNELEETCVICNCHICISMTDVCFCSLQHCFKRLNAHKNAFCPFSCWVSGDIFLYINYE